MKINKNKNKKKILLSALIILMLLVGGAAAFIITSNKNTPSTGDSLSSDKGTNSTPNTTPQHPTDATSNSVKNNTTKNNSTSSTTPSSQETAVVITSVADDSDKVTIRTLIQKVTSQGTCELTIKNQTNGMTYQDTANVQALPNSSTCQGFSVMKSELAGGTWLITINYRVNGVSNGTTSKEVPISA